MLFFESLVYKFEVYNGLLVFSLLSSMSTAQLYRI